MKLYIWKGDAEAPIFWPPDAKSRLTGKDPDAGKDWGQEEKGETEDEMVRHRIKHHWLDGQTPGEDREAWHAAVHRIAKSWTWLSSWTTITLINNKSWDNFAWNLNTILLLISYLPSQSLSMWVLDSHCCLPKTFVPQAWCWATTPVNIFKWKNCCVLSFFYT